MYTPSILALFAVSGLSEARTLFDARHIHNHPRNHMELHARATQTAAAANNDGASGTTLLASAIQSGSFLDGSTEIGANVANQAPSLTSTNNFMNVCAGKTLTNGLQITTGSCNGIPMGDLPAKTAMVSSIITFPLAGSNTIQSDTTFNITVQMSNLVAGSFTNADATYFSAPQQLKNGQVVGHTHVTVQDMGNTLNPTTPLDATQFAFFKGINDAGNGQGLLSATVTGGLPAGNYRVCTMASSSNHQPVIMPVAQRGTADDCTKFTVVGSGTTANAASNNGSGGQAAAALAASAVAAGPGFVASESTSASSAVKAASSSVASSAASATKAAKTTAIKLTSANVVATSSNSKASKPVKTAIAASSTSQQNVASKTTTVVSQATQTTIVKQVVVIETFFEFTLSLGGLPPSVGKQGGSFVVLEEIFEDIITAAGAACTAQYETCISFSGPGFSIEECASQKSSCSSAAQTQTSASSANTITATATVPPTASVTGSVIAVTTITTSAPATTQTVVVPATSSAPAIFTSIPAALNVESSCALVTSTVLVDPPAASSTSCSAASTTVFV